MALGVLAAPAAWSQADQATLQNLQNQIQELQRQLNQLQQQQAKQAQQAASAPAPAAAPAAAAPPAPKPPGIQAGPLVLTFGGFTELAMIYRNRNETADVGSNFNTGIPYPQSPQYHISELRFSARQSRLSLLTQGPDFGGGSAEAWFEMDFLGAAPTANSNESNSYNLRMRNIYGRYISDSGFYILAGQNWSLLTLEKTGMNPRQELTPLTIDAQYVAGFNWTRNSQVRFVWQPNPIFSAGLSVESPQTLIYNGPNAPTVTTVINNAGGSLFAPTNNYTLDPAPDVIGKVALDPGWGHYELSGMARWFRSRAAMVNQTTSGGGVGAGLVLPLAPQGVLDFQASGLYGKGIGRYASAQLPDVTVRPDGVLATVQEYDLLLGLNFRPTSALTLYLYGGREHADPNAFTAVVGGKTLGYGYGSPLYDNSGCLIENSKNGCVANTSDIDQVSTGGWWKYYQGPLGNLQFGLQYSYTKRKSFTGVGGDPSTDISMIFASFRYYPYQK
jgi:hypothetical protein